MSESAPAGPLAGLRIVDLTSVIVGPACTQRLADYGAEVVKIEPPAGDTLRSLGGPSPTGAHSGTYLHLNRRKRAVCLDLKKPEALVALARLLDRADALVSNMRPEALARLGLDAASVRDRWPRLVHCTITGFGPGGPYRGRPAYDSVVQAACGIAGLNGARDGTPAFAPLFLADHVTGEIAAGAMLAALLGQVRTGAGCAIEIPMHETMAAFVLQEHLSAQTFEPPLGPAGDARALNKEHRPLRTSDGWVAVTANTDAQVRAFLKAVDREDLIEDPRFRTMADRYRNTQDWLALRAQAIAQRTTADWLARFEAVDVPVMPCHSLETLPGDPHLSVVGLLGAQPHPTEGDIRTIRPTVLDSGIAPTPGRPAMPIGYDTRTVLEDAGFDADAIDRLVAGGAARDGRPGS